MNNDTISKYKQYATAPKNTFQKEQSTISSGGVNGVNNEYYTMAKNQEYAALLDKEIELENAKSNALKLTNNQIASQGMSNQGYGSSQMSSISNRYLNAYSQAGRDYQTNIGELNKQEHQEVQEADKDRFESITQMMVNAQDVSQLNSLLSDYEYGTTDNEGNFTFNEKPEGMSNDDWYQMKYYYNLQKTQLENSNSVDEYAAMYGNLDSWNTATYLTDKGKTMNVGQRFKYESRALWTNIASGKYNYGTTVKLENRYGDTIYVQWTQNGLKMSDQKTYEESDKKENLKWKENVSK